MKPIFVSSTFRDMHQERDAIRNRVTPELNDIARQYGESVAFCDLRWGVNTTDLESDEAFLTVIDACLDEIDRCNPYMVVLLGDRYGWCPEDTLVEMVASQRPGVVLDGGHNSVTALEIAYGALSSRAQKDKTFFYFRQIEGSPPDIYCSESQEDARRMAALKSKIMRSAPDQVRTYRVRWDEAKNSFVTLDHFCDMVVSDIRQVMEKQWHSNAHLTPYQRDQVEQWGIAQQKENGFAARQSLVDTVINRRLHRGGILAVQGPSGCGKSTLMSRAALQLQQKGERVLPIFCGSTKLCCNAVDVIKYVIDYLETLLGLPHFSETQAGNLIDDKQWHGRMEELYSIYDRQGSKKLRILIDAVDQLSPDSWRDKLQFLPAKKLRKIDVVFSCLDTFAIKKRLAVLQIPPVEPAEREQIIRTQLGTLRSSDSVAQPVIDAIIAKKGSASPLYLSLLLQRLDMLNRYDYAEIQTLGSALDQKNVKNAQMQSITDYQIKVISECPDDMDQMCAHILQQAAAQMGGNMAMICAELLAVSRYGLRESDLAAVFERMCYPWSSLDFSRFRKYLQRFFIYRKDGRVDFAHRIFREGLLRRCGDQRRVHRLLLQHLSALDPTDELRMQEIAHHMICADDKRAFALHITDHLHNPYILTHAAQSVFEVALQDRGRWLLSLVQDHPELLSPTLLDWVEDGMWKLLDPTQARLEIQRMVLEGIRGDWAQKRSSHPSSAATEELAKCCYLLGQVLFALGTKDDLEAALSVFEECRQLRQSLAQRGSAQAQEALADVYDSIARTILQKKHNVGLMLGDISSSQADAAKLYRTALELRKEVAGKKPDRASLEKLAAGYETYSITLRYAKGYKEAKKESLEAAQEALRLRTDLHNTFSDLDSLSMLASAYENLGQLQCFYEMISEAGKSYGNSLQMRTALAEAAEDETSRRRLSGVYKMIGILCDYASFRDLNALIKLIGEGNNREVREDQSYALQMFRQSLRLDEELAQELNTVEALDQYQQALFNIITNFRSSLAEKFRCIKIRHGIRKELFSRTQNTKYQNFFIRNFIEVKRIFEMARDKFGNIVWLLPVAGVVAFLLIMGLFDLLDGLLLSLFDMMPSHG